MYNDFFTLEVLATFSGLVAATGIIVQFTKPIIKKSFSDVAVRLYTWIISLILTFAFARNGTGVQGILLAIINSILVALTSMGAYENIADPRAEKKK
jgi:hypothetical protein